MTQSSRDGSWTFRNARDLEAYLGLIGGLKSSERGVQWNTGYTNAKWALKPHPADEYYEDAHYVLTPWCWTGACSS